MVGGAASDPEPPARPRGDPPEPDASVDTRGLLCPMPIIKLAELVRRLSPGAVAEVISDDPGIQPDLPAWCRSHGHELLALREEPRGVWRGMVRKRGPRNQGQGVAVLATRKP